jgi:hypothetical protein
VRFARLLSLRIFVLSRCASFKVVERVQSVKVAEIVRAIETVKIVAIVEGVKAVESIEVDYTRGQRSEVRDRIIV